ncbi:MAG: ABC transporter permease [Anaerolineaceae bacterium]
MKILSIAWKDLKIFFKEPGYLIYLIVLPLVFILLFTTLFSASIGSTSDTNKISLVVVNLDPGGEQAEQLLKGLVATGTIQVIPSTLEKTQADFRDTRITQYLTIPENFSQNIAVGKKVEVTLTALDTFSMSVQTLRMSTYGVVNDMLLERSILQSLEQFAAMQSALPPENRLYDPEMLTAQAKSQFISSKERPLVDVKVEVPQTSQTSEEDFSMVQFSVPGFTVLFAFLVSQATARSIYDEKKNGSFRRLMAAPLSKLQLLGGKLLPNFLVVIFQILVIFFTSTVLLSWLGMDRLSLGQSPLTLAAISIMLALCSTSLGILIAAIAKTEAQIGGVSALFLWLMGFLGGTMVPLDVMSSPMLNTISKFIPHSYAVGAYKDVLTLGAGFNTVLPALGVLLGFSILFFAIGLWRFDFD